MKKTLISTLLALACCSSAFAAEPDAELRAQAEQGNAEAQYQMARFYERQNEVEKAVPWYEKAVAQNHAKAQNNLGALYMWGKGVAKDTEKGCKLIEASHAQMGSITGTLNVAACNDQREHPDFRKAFENYKIAAEQGDAAAQRLLGQMYASGDGTKQDYQQAVYWLRQAALQEDAQAMYELGLHYGRAQGVPDYGKANAIAAYTLMKSAEGKQVITDADAFRKARFAENLAKLESKIPPEQKAQMEAFGELIRAQPMKNILAEIDKLVPLDKAAPSRKQK